MMITPDSGGTEAIRVPSLAGSWVPGGIAYQLPLSEELTQASAPDPHGNYALTGTVTVSGIPCFTHGTLQGGSFVSGGLGRKIIMMNDGSTVEATLNVYPNGPTIGRPRVLVVLGTISGGKCDGLSKPDLK